MQKHAVRWKVAPRFAARFTPAVLDTIVSGDIVCSRTTVRELAGRTVWRLSLEPESLPEVYLKKYSIRPSQIVRSSLFPYAAHEWRTARKLQQRGIPTFAPVALGWHRRCGLYRVVYLLSEALPASRTLKEHLAESGAGRCPQDMISAFAAFIVGLHRKGVLHRDLHWGNILVQTLPGQDISFCLVDLHNVRVKQHLSPVERLENLALLNASFDARVSTADRLRFLKSYCASTVTTPGGFRRVRNALVRETRRILARRWRKLARRCLGQNRYFSQITVNALRGYALRGGCPEVCTDLLRAPDDAFHDSRAVLLKDSRATTSTLLPGWGAGAGMYIKRFNTRGVLYTLKKIFCSSRARHVWLVANSLLARGVPTPRPLAYAEQRRFRVPGKSYIITEMISGAQELDQYVRTHFPHMTRLQKQDMLRLLARCVKTLHAGGISHGDLKARNILIRHPDRAELQFFFVDLDAATVGGPFLHRKCLKDLARLNCSFLDTALVSGSQRLFFLKCYLGICSRQAVRATWHSIVRATRRKLRKSGRSFHHAGTV